MLAAALLDLLTFLSKMPDLNFSQNYLDEFFHRTNSLTGDTTLANYQAAHPFSHEKEFYLYHHINVSNYLERWPQLIQKLERVFGYIKLVAGDYLEVKLSMDSLLPLFIQAMPRDKSILSVIMPKLLIAANVKKFSSTDFSFTLLYSAAVYNSNNSHEAEADMAELNICATIISKLANPSYFNILTLLLDINYLIKERLCLLVRKMYAILHELHLHDYDITDNTAADIITIAHFEKIISLADKMNEAPLKDHASLPSLMEKFKAYYDMYATINHGDKDSISKLTSITKKLQFFAGLLAEDYKEIQLTLNESLQQYLEIPNKNWLLFFNDPTISLANFIPYLAAKSESFEEAQEKERETLIIPATTSTYASIHL